MLKRLLMMTSVIGFLFIASFNVYAAEVIQFSDNHLEAAILEVMGKKNGDEVTISEAEKLQFLPLSNKEIQNLEGIQYFKNVTHLQLASNQLTDVTPLGELNSLIILDLQNNQIRDLSPLKNLQQLTSLNVNNNQLNSLETLKYLPNIGYLYASGNEIQDVSPTAHLEKLDLFDYSNNQISDISCLTRFDELRYGDLTGQKVVLPAQKVKKGEDVIINNPIKTVNGAVKNIEVKDGIYDESANQIIVKNITDNQMVEYTYETIIDYPKYDGKIDFSGTVAVEVNTTLGGAPTINGADDIEIPYGKEFNLLEGITAIDADGIDLTSEIVIEGEVDVFTTGDYEIVYRVTDHEGQTETVNRLVTVGTPVIGNQSPVINAEDRIIGKGNDFDPFEGVTAQDAEDGDLTAAIEIVQNTVNINEIGIYEVTYRVQDSNGATTIVSVNIEVHDIPTTGFSLF